MSDQALTKAPALAPEPLSTRVLARPVAAFALIAGPLALAISNAGYSLATRNGGNDLTTADALALAAAEPGFYLASVMAALIACLLLAPAALAAAGLAAEGRPLVAGIGGYAMAFGFICYFGIAFSGFDTLALAEHGAGWAEFAAATESASSGPWSIWVFLVFVAGNLLGTAILATALLLGGAIPRWAALCVFGWPVLHIIGLVVSIEWFEVAGALLLAVGFAQVALALPPSSGAFRSATRR